MHVKVYPTHQEKKEKEIQPIETKKNLLYTYFSIKKKKKTQKKIPNK